MERCELDGCARQPNWFEDGEWRDRACPADVYFDLLDEGGALFRREFERDGPSRKLRRAPEHVAQLDVVELDDDSVCVERQGSATLGPFLTEMPRRIDA